LLGVALDDDALTARLLTRIRDHAMRVKQEATPDELRSFLLESLEMPSPLSSGRLA
jgi:homocitrate synthase NifV